MMTSIADETALWSRARSGDGRAFAALFDAHRDRAFRHALRLVASAHDAEDVVAAAFFELWRKRDTVPRRASDISWTVTISDAN